MNKEILKKYKKPNVNINPNSIPLEENVFNELDNWDKIDKKFEKMQKQYGDRIQNVSSQIIKRGSKVHKKVSMQDMQQNQSQYEPISLQNQTPGQKQQLQSQQSNRQNFRKSQSVQKLRIGNFIEVQDHDKQKQNQSNNHNYYNSHTGTNRSFRKSFNKQSFLAMNLSKDNSVSDLYSTRKSFVSTNNHNNNNNFQNNKNNTNSNMTHQNQAFTFNNTQNQFSRKQSIVQNQQHHKKPSENGSDKKKFNNNLDDIETVYEQFASGTNLPSSSRLNFTNSHINEKQDTHENESNAQHQQTDYFVKLVYDLTKNTNSFNLIMAQKICQVYDIDPFKLKDIENQEKKEDYILNCMTNSISNDLKHQKDKEVFQISEIENNRKQNKKQIITQQQRLEWLNDITDHKPLQAKLKQQLIEVIEKPENQQIFQDQEKLNNQTKLLNLQTQLNDAINQNKINDIKWDEEMEKNFLEYQQIAKQRLIKFTKSSNFVENAMVPILQKLNLEENQTEYRKYIEEKYQNNEQLTIKEKKFMIQTSNLLNEHLDKKNIQEVVSIIDSEVIKKLELEIAENIIEKHNELMSKVKDERFQYITKRRFKQIQQEKEEHLKQLQKQKYQKKKQSQANELTQMRRIHEKLIYRLQQIFQKQREYNSNPIVKRFAQKLIEKSGVKKTKSNQLTKSIVKTFGDRNYPQKQEKPLFLINGEFETPSQIRRRFHPSSKVIMHFDKLQKHKKSGKTLREDIFNDGTDISQPIPAYYLQNEHTCHVQDYKLKLKQSDNLKQEKFTEFYSQGPCNERQIQAFKNKNSNYYDLEENEKLPCQQNQWITKSIENQAAITIQKFLRRVKDQSVFKQVLKDVREKRGKQIDQRVRNYWEEKKNQDLRQTIQQNIIKSKYKQVSFCNDESLQQSQQNMQKSQQHLLSSQQGILMSEKNDQYTDKIMQSSQQNDSKQQLSTTRERQETQNSQEQIQHQQQQQEQDSIMLLKNSSQTSLRFSFQFQEENQKEQELQNIDQQLKKLEYEQSKMNSQQKSAFQDTNYSNTSRTNASTSAKISQFQQPQQKNNSKNGSKQKFTKNFIQINGEEACIMPKNMQEFRDLKEKRKSLKEKEQYDYYYQQEQIKKKKAAFPKKLDIKQRKLIESAKQKNLFFAQNAGFQYVPGDDVNVKDEHGNSALFYATRNEDIPFIEFLLNLKADINFQNNSGNTPLHLAFKKNNENLIIKFVDCGGNLNIPNNQGFTPLAYGTKTLLESLGLEQGVIKATENYHTVDNNELLKINQRHEVEVINHRTSMMGDDKTDIGLNYAHTFIEEANQVQTEIPVLNVKAVGTFHTKQQKEESLKILHGIQQKVDQFNQKNPQEAKLAKDVLQKYANN